MGNNIKNKDRGKKRFWFLRGVIDKSYKMRTEKKTLPYVLIEHKIDLLGASYTNCIRGLLSGLTTN